MGSAGFDYAPVPYYAYPDLAPLDYFLAVEGADDFGYHSVRSAVLIALTPRGEPPLEMEFSERQAYDVALTGSSTEPASADQTFEQGFDGEDDGETGEGGCRAAAAQAFPSSERSVEVDADQEQLIGEFFERLSASTEFVQFDEAWAACMVAAGHPEPGSVTWFALEQDAEFVERTFAAVEQLELTKQSDVALASTAVITEDSFALVFSTYPLLGDLEREEIQVATADRACRSEHWHLTDEVAALLSEELLGQPFAPDW